MSYAYATGSGLYDWTNREIELFYVRYLEIKGLSDIAYHTFYDERHMPERLRRPHVGGLAEDGTGWLDRPDHNKHYPDIAVPLESYPTFTIASGTNQSIWVDVYIPKTASHAIHAGNVIVKQGGVPIYTIPVELAVKNFELPDTPSAKTMLYMGYTDICKRITGESYPNPDTGSEAACILAKQRYIQMAHRHKISMIDENEDGHGIAVGGALDYWLPALDGSLFTSANGYDGPGVGVGNGIFSVGTYGGWRNIWDPEDPTELYAYTDAWVNWFADHATSTEYFLYLVDEPAGDEATRTLITDYIDTIHANPGPGADIPLLATISAPNAQTYFPGLNISVSTYDFGVSSTWAGAVEAIKNDPTKKFYMYNGYRPAGGSFVTDDDGVALRVTAWTQFKKEVERWFYWESAYYNRYSEQTDVFNTAHTFGSYSRDDVTIGQTGSGYGNGDGVLIYPGTDRVYPASSYELPGPIASLRLKYWRKGLQDVDYLTLAHAINPTATDAIVQSIIPTVVFENGVDDINDPSYGHQDISWSTDPDVWEAARQQLVNIIESGS